MSRAEFSLSFVFALVGMAAGPSPLAAASPPPPEIPRTDSAVVDRGAITGRIRNGVTGQYLNNARVSVASSNQAAFTDQTGRFVLRDVPAGAITLEVFYTGLDRQRVAVQVLKGQIATVDVDLTGTGQDLQKLDPFTVRVSREVDATAIAINEQRFSPNIKSVAATDAFGDVTDGNVIAFLKLLPGVTESGTIADGSGISVRGLGSDLTVISTDGTQTANANTGGADRTFQFEQLSLNNAARVEVYKVPTPADPADSLGGIINLVSKSAFERKDAQLNYRVFLTGNKDDLSLRKTPSAFEKNIHKVRPGFNLDYTLPISERFGLVVTALHAPSYSKVEFADTIFTAAGTSTGASIQRPYLQRPILHFAPQDRASSSASARADWRITPHSVLSLTGQIGYYDNESASEFWGPAVGTNGTPTPATGARLNFGDTFTQGATGRGAVTTGGAFSDTKGVTTSEILRYRLDDGVWRISAGVSDSSSRTWIRNTSNGHFTGLTTVFKVPVRVNLADFNQNRPQTIEVFDNNNNAVDIYDINNYLVQTATSIGRDVRDTVDNVDASARRSISQLRFPLAVEIGGRQQTRTRDARLTNAALTYNGISGNLSAAPFLSRTTRGDSGFGFTDVPWPSPYLAYQAYQSNPGLFTMTPAQQVAAEVFRLSNSMAIKEKVSALYLDAESKLFNDRLRILTGARYERTEDSGRGPLFDPSLAFVRNANGTFAHDAAGRQIRRPEAGAAGSIEEVRVTRTERGLTANKVYDGIYPSVHVTYNFSDALVGRVAYAKTYGRPNFTNIIPNASINEKDLTASQLGDPNVVPGTIVVTNPSLRPWSADNYDLSLEYYTQNQGVASVGAFRKNITNFFGDEVKLATANDLQTLGLDPRYLGWQVSTTINAGSARVSGVEVDLRQSLSPLGSWGKHFTAFFNATQLHLEGQQEADFTSFIPRSMSWGFSCSIKPVILMAQWNYRGTQKRGAQVAFGPDAFEYLESRTQLDLNVNVLLSKRISLFANMRNVFNEPDVFLRYGSATPDYAKHFRTSYGGSQITVGVKGTF